jgi:hypothetical protein
MKPREFGQHMKHPAIQGNHKELHNEQGRGLVFKRQDVICFPSKLSKNRCEEKGITSIVHMTMICDLVECSETPGNEAAHH